MQFIQIFI